MIFPVIINSYVKNHLFCKKFAVASIFYSVSAVFWILWTLFQFLPVGKELLACLLALKEMVSSSSGKNVLASIFKRITSGSEGMVEQDAISNSEHADDYDWRLSPPLINCWRKLLMSFEFKDDTSHFLLESVQTLCSVALCLCVEDNRWFLKINKSLC